MQRLKEILINNFPLKILSLALACIIYLVVVNISNPEVSGSKTVSVEVVNENVLTAIGKSYEFTDGSTVLVSYTVRTRDAYKINSTDFRAYVDMNNLYDVTGSVPVTVEVVNNKELFTSTPTCKPVVLRVQLEDVVRKAVPVTAFTEGEPADGYTVGSVSVNPTSITVRGPISLTEEISYAEIYVDVEGVSGSISGTAQPVFYDKFGKPIDIFDDRITFSREKVDYAVEILVGKTVPLSFEVTGSPADGYSYTGVESNVKQVTILGSKSEIDAIDSIRIPAQALNLDGAEGDKTVSIDIKQFIPGDVVIVTDNNANVTLKVERQVERTFVVPASDIAMTGTDDEHFTYGVGPGSVEVVLSGLKADLDNLSSGSLGASVDLAGLGEGYHEVTPTYSIPSSVRLKSTANVGVSVMAVQTDGEEGDTEPAEAGSESKSEEETEENQQ